MHTAVRTDIPPCQITDRNVCSTEAGHFEFRCKTSVRDGRGCKPRPAYGDTPIVRLDQEIFNDLKVVALLHYSL